MLSKQEFAKAIRKIRELEGIMKRKDQELFTDQEMIDLYRFCEKHVSAHVEARTRCETADEYIAWWKEFQLNHVH